MKRKADFFSFTIVSGAGWLFDLLVYSSLIAFLKADTSLSNFISSFIGITFVWFFFLKLIFKKKNYGQSKIGMYWGYHFVSILLFSYLLRLVFLTLISFDISYIDEKLFAKLLVTPLNLLTNFLFMSFLVKSIKK